MTLGLCAPTGGVHAIQPYPLLLPMLFLILPHHGGGRI
jgi:hypothetical protein